MQEDALGDGHGPGLPVTPRGVLQFIIPPPDDRRLQGEEKHAFSLIHSPRYMARLPAATKNCLFDENVEKFSVT